MKNWIIAAMAAGLMLASTAALAQSEVPKGAKPGECYARVFVPATYDTTTEQVLRKEASQRIEVTPAKYTWGEEQVLVKPGTDRLDVVPAKFETVTEKVLVKPAQTVWKSGRGPIEKIDGHTGEIMCLVEEPAVYKTVTKRVMTSPPTTRRVSVPAEYKTVRVQKLAESPKERRIEIPAEYSTVTKRSLVRDGSVSWKPVLCETNMTRSTVTAIQNALSRAGFDPGPIDGVIGSQTMQALRSFQQSKGLASGAITMNTLKALNVRISS